MGDFNSALFIEDTYYGSSKMNISMREFSECVENVEVADVNSNLGFTIYLGTKREDLEGQKPKPFKFFNFLSYKPEFQRGLTDQWGLTVNGHNMFRLVKRLRGMKKPLRKLLHAQGAKSEWKHKSSARSDKPPKNKGQSSGSEGSNIDQYDSLFLHSQALILSKHYYKFNALWRQYDSLVNLPDCICENSEKSIVLTTEPILDVKGAFATLSRMSLIGDSIYLKNPSGDRLGHPSDQVLYILKHKLNFETNSKSDLYEDCLDDYTRSEKSVFAGYSFDKKRYKLFSLETKKIFYSRDVKFYETVFSFKNSLENKEYDLELKNLNGLNFFNSDLEEDLSNEPCNDKRDSRSERGKAQTSYYKEVQKYSISAKADCYSLESAILDENDNESEGDDTTYHEWIEAMNQEMEALNRNGTWVITDLPVGRKPIGRKWVFKVKYKSSGEVERFKARLVAKGFNNNIMSAGSRDRPPMLATGRYAQWRSRFLRYIDTRPNCYALRKCILEGPYTPSIVIIPDVPAIENSPAVPERTTVETILNTSLENKAHFKSEKEAIHLLLTGIGDEIYSTVDACKTAHEMWEAIERLQQVSSTTSTRIVKEVNEIRAERIAKNANPLALVATAQPHQDPYYQTSKSHKSYAPTSKTSLPTKPYATTRHKGKEIAKPITPPYESSSEEDSDPEQAQKDKEMQKIWHSLQSISRRSTNLPTTTSELPQTPESRMWILL
ncbi:retrovirus-related pol polyprotein from transposon TNT 1-94 [Tanacetum coccineum]